MLMVSCHEGVLDPRGPVGKAERIILYDSTAIMLAVIVPVIVLTLVFAWWFRARNSQARYRPDWEYSGRIEMIIWSIPALVILFLGGIAWTWSHDLDPPRPLAESTAPLDIEVVSLDWRWLFIYPHEGIASLNRLVVPAGVPLRFRLTSTTVMNSFFVPQLGSQIYAMPNMVTRLNLKADQPGTYEGLSAQFSGDGFSDMRFDLFHHGRRRGRERIFRCHDDDHRGTDGREDLQLAVHSLRGPHPVHGAHLLGARVHGDLRHRGHDGGAHGDPAGRLRPAQQSVLDRALSQCGDRRSGLRCHGGHQLLVSQGLWLYVE
jgi:cytochrome o ubiquinol oxidase subunit 2